MIGQRERDVTYMRRAVALAERGWGQTAPNPMVGAVIVNGGEVVGEGWHQSYGGPHAEVNALRQAGERARGGELFVTLEPCNHRGKTPPCSDAVRAAGISRVVAAVADPGATSGGGAERLGGAGIEVVLGVCADEAWELNASFFNAFTSDRPWVTLKLALSIDGALTDARRSSGWITGDAAHAMVHRLRANADAIAVGAGTYLADAPQLTARGEIVPRVAPLRVIFDRAARLPDPPPGQTGGSAAGDLLVVRDPDVASGLRALRERGVRSLLVEGGAGTASSLLDAGVVDRLVIFQAPIVLGGGALHAFAAARPRTLEGARRLRVVRRENLGEDLMTIYAPETA